MTANSYKEFKDTYRAAGSEQERFIEGLKEAIQKDRIGRGFIYEMFSHELAQAEYRPGDSLDRILRPLGLTAAQVHYNQPLFTGLKLAMEDYRDDQEAIRQETDTQRKNQYEELIDGQQEAINTIGLTVDEVLENPRLSHGRLKTIKRQ